MNFKKLYKCEKIVGTILKEWDFTFDEEEAKKISSKEGWKYRIANTEDVECNLIEHFDDEDKIKFLGEIFELEDNICEIEVKLGEYDEVYELGEYDEEYTLKILHPNLHPNVEKAKDIIQQVEEYCGTDKDWKRWSMERVELLYRNQIDNTNIFVGKLDFDDLYSIKLANILCKTQEEALCFINNIYHNPKYGNKSTKDILYIYRKILLDSRENNEKLSESIQTAIDTADYVSLKEAISTLYLLPIFESHMIELKVLVEEGITANEIIKYFNDEKYSRFISLTDIRIKEIRKTKEAKNMDTRVLFFVRDDLAGFVDTRSIWLDTTEKKWEYSSSKDSGGGFRFSRTREEAEKVIEKLVEMQNLHKIFLERKFEVVRIER